MARKEDCLTFGLIIQPNYIADVFELRQLVDLYAATRNTGLKFFHFWHNGCTVSFESLRVPVVPAGGSLV